MDIQIQKVSTMELQKHIKLVQLTLVQKLKKLKLEN